MNERERIEELIQTLNLSARQFAELIRIQPGTISNIMSGRNKPSLDVMQKILDKYPTLNPEWLIAGRGDMWRTVPGENPQLFDNLPPDSKSAHFVAQAHKEESQVPVVTPKKISRIVVYYSDNTFEEFKSHII
jgi:transcriptional regulator with XRE-family HTH domain